MGVLDYAKSKDIGVILYVNRRASNKVKYDSYILEADTITGPWQMVAYMKEFDTQGYFLNFPSKFISEDGKTMWLSYFANYGGHRKLRRNPSNGRYGLGLYEVKLLGDDKQQLEATQAWEDKSNIASSATITASSMAKDTSVKNLNDGKVCQHNQEIGNHWKSNADGEAWVKLSWKSPQVIRALRFFDCTSRDDNEKFGRIEFSNGRKIPIRVPLPNTDLEGLEIFWGNKEKVDWIKIVFDRVKPEDMDFSLSEIAVFGENMEDSDSGN